MILVIADDFTGAAELAGIAIGYGLKTEVRTIIEVDSELDLDVLILDTNTRSKTSQEAAEVISSLTRILKKHDFTLLYKKTDSVLRGHVYTELKKIQEYFSTKSILLAPANPSQRRIITNGNYYINNDLLHNTHFAEDPESPRASSEIMSLMKSEERSDITVINIHDQISFKSGKIYIAETKNSNEMKLWTKNLGETLIPAGGADFFDAILLSNGKQKKINRNEDIRQQEPDRKRLFICGSSLSKLSSIENKIFGNKPEVIEVSKDQLFRDYVDDIHCSVIECFKKSNNVILIVNIIGNLSNLNTFKIPKLLADITFKVFDKVDLSEILVEGGTTSSEVVRRIGWDRFKPVEQVGPGVIRLKVVDSLSKYLTVKPGSYDWPMDI